MTICFIFVSVLAIISLILFGKCLAEDDPKGLVWIVIGIFCICGSFFFCIGSRAEAQRERAVSIGFGEYSKKGERTIDDKIDYIISGNRQ